MLSQRRKVILVFALVALTIIVFLPSTNFSVLFSGSGKDDVIQTPSSKNQVKIITFTSTSKANSPFQDNKRQETILLQRTRKNEFWIPETCLNYFAHIEALRKVHNLINWSTPIYSNQINFPNHKEFEELLQLHNASSIPHEKRDLCSYWKVGRFPEQEREEEQISQDQLRRRYASLAVSDVHPRCTLSSSQNNNNNLTLKSSHSPTSECSIGLCLAKSFASLLKNNNNNNNNNKQEKIILPSAPTRTSFLLLIGDSRVRNLFQRLIMMFRSNKNSGFEEMVRRGISDNYYHQNATYTISKTTRKDEIRILPFGVGCDSQEHVLNRLTATKSADEDELLLMVCLQWHYRTTVVRRFQFDTDVAKVIQKSKPDSVLWMPTLHDCVSRRCENGDAHVDEIEKFSKMLLRQLDPQFDSSNFSTLLTNEENNNNNNKSTNHRNHVRVDHEHLQEPSISNRLIFASAPTAVWAKYQVIKMRNNVLRDLEKYYRNSNNDDNNNIRSKMPTPRFRFIDFCRYVNARNPPRCDAVHNMCNFRPMMGTGNVTHFRATCGGCTDVPDYCFWLQFRRALI